MIETESNLSKLEKFDFSTNEAFELESYNEAVHNLKIERETLKQFEAENVIKELGKRYIDLETIESFDAKKENLRNFIRRFGADKEELQKMSNEAGGERDKLYSVSNYLYNKFATSLNDIEYNMKYTWDEFNFIIKTINHKLEYNSDEVFQLSTFKSEFFDAAQEDFKKVGKDNDLYIKMKMSSIILMYHLLSKYKVGGVDKNYYLYVSVLDKIGEANKVFNAFNIIKERINTEFTQWAVSITPEDGKENENAPVVEKTPKGKK